MTKTPETILDIFKRWFLLSEDLKADVLSGDERQELKRAMEVNEISVANAQPDTLEELYLQLCMAASDKGIAKFLMFDGGEVNWAKLVTKAREVGARVAIREGLLEEQF